MNQMRFPALIQMLVALSAAALACGCGDGSGVGRPLPVQGKVTLGGQPLPKGAITFHPDDTKGNKLTTAPVGTIENGQYSLATGTKPGAPAGWYKVTITSVVPSDPKDEYSQPRSLINTRFGDPSTSGLAVEVKGGQPAYDFPVMR